MLFKFVDDND